MRPRHVMLRDLAGSQTDLGTRNLLLFSEVVSTVLPPETYKEQNIGNGRIGFKIVIYEMDFYG